MGDPGERGISEGVARAGSRAKRHGATASLGAIAAAFLASLCCIGPLVFVTLGVGAGLAAWFEPLRPALIVVTLVFLALGFYWVYGRKTVVGGNCDTASACVVPQRGTRDKALLWLSAAFAILLLTFPQWSKLFV